MSIFEVPKASWATRQEAKNFVTRFSFALALSFVALFLGVLCARGIVGTNQLGVMAIGCFVGGVELLGRYRHAPSRAMMTWSGLLYMLVNVGASWAAYATLQAFDAFANVPKAKDLIEICTAGFGSLVVMRSSFFKVKVGDSDVGIGPAAILDTLLLVADRGVDRREAVARAQDVTELVSHVRDPAIVAKMLTKYSLALMQNVDKETAQTVTDAIAKIMADAEIPDAIKMDIVALRLGIIVGPDVLEAAVSALGDRLGVAVSPPPPPKIPAPAGWNVVPTGADLRDEIATRQADPAKRDPMSGP